MVLSEQMRKWQVAFKERCHMRKGLQGERVAQKPAGGWGRSPAAAGGCLGRCFGTRRGRDGHPGRSEGEGEQSGGFAVSAGLPGLSPAVRGWREGRGGAPSRRARRDASAGDGAPPVPADGAPALRYPPEVTVQPRPEGRRGGCPLVPHAGRAEAAGPPHPPHRMGGGGGCPPASARPVPRPAPPPPPPALAPQSRAHRPPPPAGRGAGGGGKNGEHRAGMAGAGGAGRRRRAPAER